MGEWHLEDFEFYTTLVTDHAVIFEQARRLQCTICIPPNGSIPADDAAAVTFFKRHLLLPSKEFKGLWASLGREKRICQDGAWIHIADDKGAETSRARILHEDIILNDEHKPMRVLFLQKPLAGTACWAASPDCQWQSSHKDMVAYLRRFADRECMSAMDTQIQQFISTYLIFEGYEHILANKVKDMVDTSVQKIVTGCQRIQDAKRNLVQMQLAVHCYIMNGIYDKVFTHFTKVSAEKDAALEAFKEQATKPLPSLERKLMSSYASAMKFILQLDECHSAYLKMHHMNMAIDAIAQEAAVLGVAEDITADIMVPLLGSVILRASSKQIYANVQLTSLLCPEALKQTELHYACTTFEAAMQWLLEEASQSIERRPSSSPPDAASQCLIPERQPDSQQDIIQTYNLDRPENSAREFHVAIKNSAQKSKDSRSVLNAVKTQRAIGLHDLDQSSRLGGFLTNLLSNAK